MENDRKWRRFGGLRRGKVRRHLGLIGYQHDVSILTRIDINQRLAESLPRKFIPFFERKKWPTSLFLCLQKYCSAFFSTRAFHSPYQRQTHEEGETHRKVFFLFSLSCSRFSRSHETHAGSSRANIFPIKILKTTFRPLAYCVGFPLNFHSVNQLKTYRLLPSRS